jgi:hypothetical protein
VASRLFRDGDPGQYETDLADVVFCVVMLIVAVRLVI